MYRKFFNFILIIISSFVFVFAGCGDKGATGPQGPAGSGGNLNVVLTCNGSVNQTVGFTNSTGSSLSVTGICADTDNDVLPLGTVTVAAGAVYTSQNLCVPLAPAFVSLDCSGPFPITCIFNATAPGGTTFTGGVSTSAAC